MKIVKRVVIIALLVIGLLNVPILKFDYYEEGRGMYSNRYSISDSLIMDIEERIFLTPYLIKQNILGNY